MVLKVLGPGCRNCKTVLEMTKAAVEELSIEADVQYITDMGEISKYIMLTPGLVADEKVLHEGKPLPSYEQVKKLISEL